MNTITFDNFERMDAKMLLKHVDWFELCNDWKDDTEDKQLHHEVREFITKYQDYVDWKYVSGAARLTEQFIRQFKDRVDWDRISSNQNISQEFAEEFKDRINWERFNKNAIRK